MFSSSVLVIVVKFFIYSLCVIFKQKRLSEIQKDFINNMTHEFKTPISTIAVSAEVLKNPDITLHFRDEEYSLTQKENAILELFCKNKGKVLKRNDILIQTPSLSTIP